tara:strand:+ start:2511 stop:3086 length:576 start_codon:yes stop_codon:yes gene_type:complete
MYKLFTDKTELFECNIKLEGASLKNSQARLIIESEDINLLFKGQITPEGKCIIPIKKLKGLLEGNTKGEIKLEVIAEDTYFTPWKSEFVVEASRKLTVEVKSQDANLIIESAPKVQVSGIKETQNLADPITEHILKLVKLLIKEDVNINNLSIKKDKVNNIIATYTKVNPIQETQLPKIINGILNTLPKTK